MARPVQRIKNLLNYHFHIAYKACQLHWTFLPMNKAPVLEIVGRLTAGTMHFECSLPTEKPSFLLRELLVLS